MRLSPLASVVLATALSSTAVAQEYSLSSTVAAPSTKEYQSIKLIPQQNPGSTCELNTIYVDNTGNILFCPETSSPTILNTWRPTTAPFSPGRNIYLAGQFSYVGIGTINPENQLHIKGEGSFLVQRSPIQNNREVLFYWNSRRSTLQAGSFKGAPTAAGATAIGTDVEASGASSTVTGGTGNRAWAEHAVVSGGINNSAGLIASVAGGSGNEASGMGAAVAGGADNKATGNGSFVSGGNMNVAKGEFSWAGGLGSYALGNRTFVWGHASDRQIPVTANNAFVIQTGKVGIGDIDPQTALSLKPGTAALADAWLTRMPEVQNGAAPIKDALAVITNMNSRYYTTKNGDHVFGLDTAQLSRLQASKGLFPIVREINKTSSSSDGTITAIDYGQVVAVLVEAVKQQQATIEEMRRALDLK